MRVIVAKSAGFCYGVNRAVGLVEQAVAEGKQVVTLGPIAHNRHLVQSFAERGVTTVASLDEIPDGATVIIRSHGVPRATYAALAQRNVTVIDATCPSVKRIHSQSSSALRHTPRWSQSRAGAATLWSFRMRRNWVAGLSSPLLTHKCP